MALPTDLPWGVVFGGSAGMEPRGHASCSEALLEGALLFAILFVMSRKRPPFARGTYFGVFMVGYGICRFLIEFVRQPDAQLGYLWGGWLTMGQVLSVLAPLIVAGVVLLVYALKPNILRRQRGSEGLVARAACCERAERYYLTRRADGALLQSVDVWLFALSVLPDGAIPRSLYLFTDSYLEMLL